MRSIRANGYGFIIHGPDCACFGCRMIYPDPTSPALNIEQLSRAMLFSMEKMQTRKAWEDLSFAQQSAMIAVEYDNLTQLAKESV